LNYFNCFSEIEETFIRRRGKGLLLSPFDWALMEVWQEKKIPLHIVLRGIELVFDNYEKSASKKRSIKGLSFCREEVEVQFSEWQESQIGKAEDEENENIGESEDVFSREKIATYIESLIGDLKSSKYKEFEEIFARVVERLNDLHKNLSDNYEQIEGSFNDIETIINEGLKQNTEKLHLKSLTSEIEKQLSKFKSTMAKEDYRKTFDIMLLKKLREEYGIPRLSLFYL
jgi:hypothetical protein